MVNIIDRRDKALGGQSYGRSESSITGIAWHYTAVARESRAFITGHENYWKNTLGWRRGGYHYYIDADGKIYQNYNLTTISNGVRGHNSKIVNISVEANSASNYSKVQEDARRNLTLYLMKRLNLPASAVKQHSEFSGQSTSCAGYTKAQMNAFRNELGGGKAQNIKPSAAPKSPSKPSVSWTKVSGSLDGKPMVKGYYGSPVRELQQRLVDRHFYPDKGATNNGVDGYFGAKTEDAVRRYQSAHGLTVDGFAGPATQKSLGVLDNNTSSIAEDGFWGKDTTRALQKALGTSVDGVISGQYPNATTNSIYSASFTSRVGSDVIRALQRKIGVNGDGYLGPNTVRALQRYLGTAVDGVISQPSLMVKELQRRLNNGTL